MAGSDRWVRSFIVGEAKQHRRGFTLYKITSYLFLRSSPEALTVVTVWKRFSELQKLQRKMKKLHEELYLKGTCPSYAKWSYFRRFDTEVIEERKKTTLSLLEFVALHSPLFTSSEFVKFFQASHPDPNIDDQNNLTSNIEAIRSSLLLPTEVAGPIEYQSSEEDSFSIIDSSTISTSDSVSVKSSTLKKSSSNQSLAKKPTNCINSNGNSEIDSADLTINLLSDINRINSLLQSAKEEVGTTTDKHLTKNKVENKPNLPDLLSFDKYSSMETSQISMDSNDTVFFTNSSSFEKLDVDIRDGIPDFEDFDNKMESAYNTTIPQMEEAVSLSRSVTSNFNNGVHSDSVIYSKTADNKNGHRKANSVRDDVSERVSFTRSSSRLDTLSIDTVFTSFADMQENYVFEAGYLLSLGARNETKGDYYRAFDCYKAGIEKLLIGVQGDTNELRRQFVKDKTTKYLSHAERLYTTYLNDPNCEMPESKYYVEVKSKYSMKKCDVSELCRPYQELAKYRVLGVIGEQVLLVLSSEAQECHAMKVVQKKSNQISDDEFFNKGSMDNKLPILPINIPYMVNLKMYIETPNLLFLVLQYASGGKLFDYINNHAKTVPNTPAREVNLDNVFVDLQNLNKAPSRNDTSFIPRDILESIENNDKDETDEDECDAVEAIELDDDVDQLDNFDKLSITDMVINSQRLLLNVDDALTGKFLNKNDNIESNDKQMDNGRLDVVENGGRLTLMVTEVEQAFDGIQEKLDKITQSDSVCIKSALPPKSICKWGAELLIAIDHLHQHGVICRTLNPDNLLMGDQGQLLLTYIIGYNSDEVIVPLFNAINCGGLHNVYIAPELLQFSFLSKSLNYDERVCDFWSYGTIMYELITGLSLCKTHPAGINSHTILDLPEDLPKEAESLLTLLLNFNPSERLGSGPSGIEEIKYHPYFNHIDWHALEEEALTTSAR